MTIEFIQLVGLLILVGVINLVCVSVGFHMGRGKRN